MICTWICSEKIANAFGFHAGGRAMWAPLILGQGVVDTGLKP